MDEDESKATGWFKLTRADGVHGDMRYKVGLNEDVHPFNAKTECGKGGLYFCRRDKVAYWILGRSRPHEDELLWDVTCRAA